MAVLNFKNKKLAFAIAKPIEYLMPKMCLSWNYLMVVCVVVLQLLVNSAPKYIYVKIEFSREKEERLASK